MGLRYTDSFQSHQEYVQIMKKHNNSGDLRIVQL